MNKSKIRTRETPKEKVKKNFFETLPGIITAIAALMTAIGGCIAIFLSPQILDRLFPPATAISPIIQVITSTPPEMFPTTKDESVAATPTSIAPRIYDFQACPLLCNGQNSTNNFATGITKIYLQFNYENFKSGAPYTRTWTMGGREWIRYTCAWDGPSSGTELLKLTEPKGLASGTWEIRVIVNNIELLAEEIVIVGNGKYWDPAGVISSCHGVN